MAKNIGKRTAITRSKETALIEFAASATVATNVLDLSGVSLAAFIFPEEFAGDTITLKTSESGDTGFTITGATGRVNLTSEQALAFAPMGDLIMSTGSATSAAATVKVLLFY